MKFLVDNALSPLVAEGLKQAGYDAMHLRDFNMQGAADTEVFDLATLEQRVLISSDTDFGTILVTRRARFPSVILLRRPSQRRTQEQIRLLVENLPELNVLREGCLAVFDESRIRIRMLPIAEHG